MLCSMVRGGITAMTVNGGDCFVALAMTVGADGIVGLPRALPSQ